MLSTRVLKNLQYVQIMSNSLGVSAIKMIITAPEMLPETKLIYTGKLAGKLWKAFLIIQLWLRIIVCFFMFSEIAYNSALTSAETAFVLLVVFWIVVTITLQYATLIQTKELNEMVNIFFNLNQRLCKYLNI